MSLESRRAFLKRLKYLWTPVILGSGATYGYGSLLERHRIVVERSNLKLPMGPGAPKRLRMVSLSDFHYDPLHEASYVEEIVRQTNALRPDVVFLTGDFITDVNDRMEELAELLGKLNAPGGTYACLGTHDYREHAGVVSKALRKQGIEMLINQHTRVRGHGGELIIAGLESVWGGMPNWEMAAKGIKPDERAIVLMHEPDYATILCRDDRAGLQISGHTHGGQICLPGLGAIRRPLWGKLYEAGFYDLRRMKLYVSRGLGTIHLHMRLFCPPEITCFDLTNADVIA